MELMGDDAVAIISSAPVAVRNSDVNHEYRQDSNFFYLTGFEEPEAVCILSPGAVRHKFVLFVRPRDPAREMWTGARAGVKGAMETFGADTAYVIGSFDRMLPRYLIGPQSLYHNFVADEGFTDKLIDSFTRLSGHGSPNLVDAANLLGEMRVLKDHHELTLLRRAIEITGDAQREAMMSAKPGMGEYEIEAVVEYVFRRSGAQRPGFPSIIGSGPNTTTLHYERNDRIMNKGDLLLVDIGAEWGYYTADITRTFPVSGRFNQEQ